MGRLTQKDKCGNWSLKGLAWENLTIGASITRNTWEKLYGALCKLLDYEETGLSPEEIEERTYCAMETPCEYQSSSSDKWILVEEEMPKERKSMFAKLKNTERWSTSMFEKKSDDVNVTVEYEDGTRRTVTMHTLDGEWKYPSRIIKQKAIAWQPLPEPYRAEERIETNGEES